MTGCDAAYLIAPNLHPDEPSYVAEAIDACQVAGVTRVVYHSVASPYVPEMPHHLGKAVAEDLVRRSGLAWTILQPGVYLQNFDLSGPVQVPYDVDAPFGFLDLADLGAAAATGADRGRPRRRDVRAGVPAGDRRRAGGRGRRPAERVDDSSEHPWLRAMFATTTGTGSRSGHCRCARCSADATLCPCVDRVSLVACLGLLLAGCSDDDPEPPASDGCNGHVELCERAYDEVAYAATHNSMSAANEPGWLFTEQPDGIIPQLDYGVRVLLIDSWYGQTTDRRGIVATADKSREVAFAQAKADFGTRPVNAALRVRRTRPGTDWRCPAVPVPRDVRARVDVLGGEPARDEGLAGRPSP